MLKKLSQPAVPFAYMICSKCMVLLHQMTWHLVPPQHKDSPTNCPRHQSRRCFVNVHIVLQRNERVPKDKNGQNENVHVDIVRARLAGMFCLHQMTQRVFKRLGSDQCLLRMNVFDIGQRLADDG